jgi:hypothetical protein
MTTNASIPSDSPDPRAGAVAALFSRPVDTTGARLADSDRIGYRFCMHDRHDVNLDAAHAYLAWGTGLTARCEADEPGVFRVGEPS